MQTKSPRLTMALEVIVLILLWLIEAKAASTTPRPLCQVSCGNNVQIPFPFGIGKGCYMNKNFEVRCNNSRPFLISIGMELLEFQTDYSFIANNPVIHSSCSNKSSTAATISLEGTPFYYSKFINDFTATGCNNHAVLILHNGTKTVGCNSACRNGTRSSCTATLPPYLQSFQVNMTSFSSNRSSCRSAFISVPNWIESQPKNIIGDYSPAEFIWGDPKGSCDISKIADRNCTSSNCWAQVSTNQFCICSECQDVGKCTDPKNFMCSLYYLYNPADKKYMCPPGYKESDTICFPDFGGKSRMKAILIGCGSGFGSLLVLTGIWSLYKIIKRRRAMKQKQNFFKRNGGLLLEQQLCSSNNHVDKTKLFTSTELEHATDNYHKNRILGHGGQGTVYKGMLTDGKVVAIKKSKKVDEDKLAQFINEVVILSQINHRNVVKLIGCCLETEVPMLVYEFIPNGTLFDYLQHPDEELAFTWEIRIRIAAEIAGALAYLHSSASTPIYHRDIKSSNILLDDKYRAKLADFGTSRSISIEDTHVTTRVQGTFGYLDPEFFQSSQFTDKSDVYSFGVVLAELLTGEKPVFSSSRSTDCRSLATHFLRSMEGENRLFEILDALVLKESKKEQIVATAKLAQRCLNLNGRMRPTMKTVALELEGIRRGSCIVEEQAYDVVDISESSRLWDIASSSSHLEEQTLVHHYTL